MKGESEVPGRALNLISANYPDHGHHGRLPLSRKHTHGRAGNRTRDLMISSQALWPPSHEAGRVRNMNLKKSRATITFLLFSWHNQSNGGMRAQLPPGARRSKHRKCGVCPWRENCSGMTQFMNFVLNVPQISFGLRLPVLFCVLYFKFHIPLSLWV